MKVGIACFFPWRPHVQQANYLGRLLQDDGHAVEYLVCDGQLTSCYQKMVAKRTESSFTCAKCILGGFRTYSGGKNVRLPRVDLIPNKDAIDWCQSSASTLYRGESFEHLESEEKRSIARALEPGVQRAYASTLRWLNDSNVDALLTFNGRMDVTRATIEAADAADIPFVTMERPWFGDGIQLLPGEQCIGLRGINALAVEWKSKP